MNLTLPQELTAKLKEPLPAEAVGARYLLHPRPDDFDQVSDDAKSAAVLLLLYAHNGRWQLPLTLRPSHMAAHAGQVSLPGGAVEPGETTADAAVREFHEELGDDGQHIILLGQLTPIYVRASNYRVTPWVATVGRRPSFAPNPVEVEQLLEVPLSHLMQQGNFGHHEREHLGRIYSAPHFSFHSHQIWGATCRILGELVTVLEGFRIDD